MELKGFGNIEYFFNYNDKFFVAAKKIVRLYNPYYWNEIPNIKASLSYCHLSNDILIHEISNLKKCALIKIDDRFFISTFNISHLFS